VIFLTNYKDDGSRCFTKNFSQNRCKNFKNIKNILGSNFSKEERKDLKTDKISNLKNKIQNFKWDDSIDWIIMEHINQNLTKPIVLDSSKTCSKENPLYKHKIWLERIYYDENLDLSIDELMEICGLKSTSALYYWIDKLNISRKRRNRITSGERTNQKGYIIVTMPEYYRHPQFQNDSEFRKVERFKHHIIMEEYLRNINNSECKRKFGYSIEELYRKYMIMGDDGNFYLKNECIVHHINIMNTDNRNENLYPLENEIDHSKLRGNLNKCFEILIKLGQIKFTEGKYYLSKCNTINSLSDYEINKLLRPISIENCYGDIDHVKEAIIKKDIIDWGKVSKDWTAEYRLGAEPVRRISLNPYSYCSELNRLYTHKDWVETLFNDERFNMTDERLSKICGIKQSKARWWRRKHNIKGVEEGYGVDRIIVNGYVWLKNPKDYFNPYAQYRENRIQEHRYIMEKFLVENSHLKIAKECLIDGKYLNPKCIVHHINFDTLDNRLDNLWLCKNKSEHHKYHLSLYSLVKDLLESGLLYFKQGKYYITNLERFFS